MKGRVGGCSSDIFLGVSQDLQKNESMCWLRINTDKGRHVLLISGAPRGDGGPGLLRGTDLYEGPTVDNRGGGVNEPPPEGGDVRKSKMSRLARERTEPGFGICAPRALEIRSRIQT
jgi:hypothetical protein